MTVSSSYLPSIDIADGIIVAFSYTFDVISTDDVVVSVNDATINPSSYAVDDALKIVTFSVAPLNNDTVLISRVTPLDQQVDYIIGGNFPSETHEGALDKLTLINQESSDEVRRSLRFPDGDPASTTLPSVAARAVKFLGFDSNGNPVALAGTGGGDPNAVQKPASGVTSNNFMMFDANKNALDSGVASSLLMNEVTNTSTGGETDIIASGLSFGVDKNISVMVNAVLDPSGGVAPYLVINGDTTTSNYHSSFSVNGGASSIQNTPAIFATWSNDQDISMEIIASPQSATGRVLVNIKSTSWDGTSIFSYETSIVYLGGSTITSIGVRDSSGSATPLIAGTRISVKLK